MPDVVYPAIPEPTKDFDGLYDTVQRLKESVEQLTGHREKKNSVVDLVKTFGTTSAQLLHQIKVSADAGGANAEDILRVEAKADMGSAVGQISIRATTGPTGTSAAFETFVNAVVGGFPDLRAGMKILVDAATGTAHIGFEARSLQFTDSGVSEPVFTYDGATFNFNVPVTIFNKDIGLNAVSNTSANTGQISAGGILTVPIEVRDDARVGIEVKVTDTSLSTNPFIFVGAPPFVPRVFPVLRDGVSIGSMFSMDTFVRATVIGVGQFAFDKAITPSSQVFVQSSLPAGIYTFGIQNSSPYQLGMAISVTELSR